MHAITFRQKGNFKKLNRFLEKALEAIHLGQLDKYGRKGVEALRLSTPVDSGLTANSWDYTIDHHGDTVTISWNNSHINKGVNIAVILQFGHGTGWGGYVQGRDYINPAMRPIFEEIAASAWEEVTKI